MSNSQCIVILGAGPAGLSAALWLRNLGFAPRVADIAEHAHRAVRLRDGKIESDGGGAASARR